MYSAKEAGKGTFRFFTEELHEELMEKTFFEMELRQVIGKRSIPPSLSTPIRLENRGDQRDGGARQMESS